MKLLLAILAPPLLAGIILILVSLAFSLFTLTYDALAAILKK